MSNKPKLWTLELQAVKDSPFYRVPRVYSLQGIKHAMAAHNRSDSYAARKVHLMKSGTGLVNCTGCEECKP